MPWRCYKHPRTWRPIRAVTEISISNLLWLATGDFLMTAGNGKPCVKCNTNEWDNKGNCKQCARDRTREWRKANPERKRENARRLRNENIEEHREYQRRWARENPECSRRWREKNREHVKEVGLKNNQRWRKNNPEAARAIDHRRRARESKGGGSYTVAEWKALVDHYGGKCLCCGRMDVKLTADHVFPLAMGGTNDISNIQPLCMSCNARKNAKHIDYRTKPGILRWIQRKQKNTALREA